MHLNRQLVRQKTAKTINGLLYSGIFRDLRRAPWIIGGARLSGCAWHRLKMTSFYFGEPEAPGF